MFAGGIAVRKTDGKCGPTHARLPADPIVATPPPLPPSPFPMRGRRPPELQREAQRQASRPATPGQASVRGPGGRPRRPRSPRAGGRSATHLWILFVSPPLPELSPPIPDQPSLPSTLPYRSCLCRTVAPCGRSSTHYRSAAPSPPLISSISNGNWVLGRTLPDL